jgi:hypothetical protein
MEAEQQNYSVFSKQLDEVIESLLLRNPLDFEQTKKDAPTSPGLYAIFCIGTEKCLHAGKSKNLRHRLLVQHYSGGGIGAGSDIVQKIQSNGLAEDRASAQKWIQSNCLFRWIEEPDHETRHWAEHRLLSYLRPVWCISKA